MLVTPERFASGETYAEYRHRLVDRGRTMRDQLLASEAALAKIDLDLAPYQRLQKPLKVLVLSIDSCSDCTNMMPLLNRIAEETGKLDVRVFERDDNLDLMDQYLNKGQFRSVPVVIFLDEDFNEIGHFIERPDRVTDLRAERRREIFAAHPEFGPQDVPLSEKPEGVRAAITAALTAMREETLPFTITSIAEDLGEIAQKAA